MTCSHHAQGFSVFSLTVSRMQSCSNRAEATAIATIVRRLLRAGVSPHQIGVICFFRAQVPIDYCQVPLGVCRHIHGLSHTIQLLQASLVSSLLGVAPAHKELEEAAVASAVDVATVDSFQVSFTSHYWQISHRSDGTSLAS